MVTRLLQINDVHLSDRPPASRNDGYTDQILTKLEWAVQFGIGAGVDAIAFTGDLFHLPAPSKVSHGLVLRTIKVLRQAVDSHVDLLYVPGNHDLSYGSTESLDRQPLAVVAEACEMLNLDRERWVSPDGAVVVGAAWDYSENPDRVSRWASEVPDVLVIHSAVAAATNPYYKTVHPTEYSGRLPTLRVILHGHLHAPEPVQQFGKLKVSNCGSLSRASITETHGNRKVFVGLIELDRDTLDVSVEHISVEAALPAFQVLREIAPEVTHQSDAIRKLVESMSIGPATKTSREALLDLIDTSGVELEVRERAKAYVLAAP